MTFFGLTSRRQWSTGRLSFAWFVSGSAALRRFRTSREPHIFAPQCIPPCMYIASYKRTRSTLRQLLYVYCPRISSQMDQAKPIGHIVYYDLVLYHSMFMYQCLYVYRFSYMCVFMSILFMLQAQSTPSRAAFSRLPVPYFGSKDKLFVCCLLCHHQCLPSGYFVFTCLAITSLSSETSLYRVIVLPLLAVTKPSPLSHIQSPLRCNTTTVRRTSQLPGPVPCNKASYDVTR